MKEYNIATRQIKVSVGESVRIIRELQELSQSDLSKASGIQQSSISAIENDQINVGVKKAKKLARALHCHPAVILYPSWKGE